MPQSGGHGSFASALNHLLCELIESTVTLFKGSVLTINQNEKREIHMYELINKTQIIKRC